MVLNKYGGWLLIIVIGGLFVFTINRARTNYDMVDQKVFYEIHYLSRVDTISKTCSCSNIRTFSSSGTNYILIKNKDNRDMSLVESVAPIKIISVEKLN